jgi:phosphoribosylformylglycinamidine synthase subunit PurS
MARVVVDVMPKPEILDPQGKAVTGALARLGFAGVTVRQGKRFELDVEGELTEERLAEVQRAAETLLANTVIETFNVRVEEAESAGVEAPDRAASEPPKGTSAAVAPVEDRGESGGDSPEQSPGGAASEPASRGAEAVASRVEDRGESGGDSPEQSPGGAASEPAARGGEAVASRVEDREGSGGDSPGQSPGGAASEPASRGTEAVDARVEEQGKTKDSHGRPPEETARDTQVQSARGAPTDAAKGTDSALDAEVRKSKETVGESQAEPQDRIAPDAQAEPPDPAASRAR